MPSFISLAVFLSLNWGEANTVKLFIQSTVSGMDILEHRCIDLSIESVLNVPLNTGHFVDAFPSKSLG